jgi:ABC-type Fe2+-enterobactin transport system substrate-binding protein
MHLIDKILNNPKEMKRIEISSLNQKLGYWKNQEKKAKKYVKKYEEKIKKIERRISNDTTL